MSKPNSERCREYVPRPAKTAGQEEAFGKKPPRPPKKPPKSMSGTGNSSEGTEDDRTVTPPLPGLETPQRAVLDAIHGFGEAGGTDSEVALKVEINLRRVVALRTELLEAGLLWDSGVRRRDQKGHEKVVWTALPVEAQLAADEPPRLVRDDVYIEQGGRAMVLHAGHTTIRLTGVPGDLVEVRTTPSGADEDQEGGAEITLLFAVEGSEEMYDSLRNPFTTPDEILETMADITAPAINVLTAVKKDL